jgi:KTSC domain
MQALDSSWLAATVYYDHLAVMQLTLRSGVVYCYLGVPAQTYYELLRAESKGKYFNSHIRNRFACAKMTALDKGN